MSPSLEEFKKDRDALLGADFDPHTFRAYQLKYGVKMSSNPLVQLGAFHKARTALTTLPIELRRQSKAWLTAHNLHSLDDGDLT